LSEITTYEIVQLSLVERLVLFKVGGVEEQRWVCDVVWETRIVVTVDTRPIERRISRYTSTEKRGHIHLTV
jgi:hypothetical protein